MGDRIAASLERRSADVATKARRYLLLYGLSYLCLMDMFNQFTDDLCLPAYAARLITDPVCYLVNFVIMHHYVFHVRRGLSGLRR